MKKKIFSFLFAMTSIFTLAGFSGCGKFFNADSSSVQSSIESASSSSHEHVYDQISIDTQYVASEATCTDQAVYYKSCVCGAVGIETFSYGELKEHIYVNGICSKCTKYYYTEGLQFTLNQGDQSYSVTDYTGVATEVIIPSIYDNLPVTSIGSISSLAFYGCSSLISVTIPNSVTSIGISAFENCKNLKNITIPNSVTSIGKFAFNNCSSLERIIIPNSISTIDSSTFQYCESLTNVIIGNNVTSIADFAFNGCRSLTNITIPNSVITIGDTAFQCCESLTSVTIGNSVTSIGNSAFYDCTNLTSITIGNSVTSIGERAFYYCTSLTSITIPDSVDSIGNRAFAVCNYLNRIEFEGTVEEWNNISKGDYWNMLVPATSVVCLGGEVAL